MKTIVVVRFFIFLQDHGDEIPDSPIGIGIWPVPL